MYRRTPPPISSASDMGVLYQLFLSSGKSRPLWGFLLCVCWSEGMITVLCYLKLVPLFSLRLYWGISAARLERQMLVLGSILVKWEHCIQSVNSCILQWRQRGGIFLLFTLWWVWTSREGSQWCQVTKTTISIVLWVTRLPRFGDTAPWVFSSETLGHYLLEQHPLLPWVNMEARLALYNLKVVLWGRVSAEQSSQISLLALVHLMLHSPKDVHEPVSYFMVSYRWNWCINCYSLGVFVGGWQIQGFLNHHLLTSIKPLFLWMFFLLCILSGSP